MKPQAKAKLIHAFFYFHAAFFCIIGFVMPEWIVPVSISFTASAVTVYRLRQTHWQSTGEEADWLGT